MLQVCVLLAFLCQEKERAPFEGALLSQVTQEQLTERHSHTGAVMLARKNKNEQKTRKVSKEKQTWKKKKAQEMYTAPWRWD